jgi:hypothetical protein
MGNFVLHMYFRDRDDIKSCLVNGKALLYL